MLWLVVTAVVGADHCPACASVEIDCYVARTACLREAGEERVAIDELKPIVREHADDPRWGRLLAQAYAADGNAFWAERTLRRHPDDCTNRAWLSWLHLQAGELDLARDDLAEAGCPATPADETRWALLSRQIDQINGEPTAPPPDDAEAIYPEDVTLYRRQRARAGLRDPVQLRLELAGGYTSNARAGSPTDPGAEGPHSAIGRMDLFGSGALPTVGHVTPGVEAGVKGTGLTATGVKRLSYLELSTRPQMRFGDHVLVGYRADLLMLRDREKRYFYEGHRGELEIEASGVTVFGGGGRRIFQEAGRTRWELDGGVGGGLELTARTQVLLAAALRYYDAVGAPYDQVGGSGLVMLRVQLGAGAYLRASATLGLDRYRHSGGRLGELAYGSSETRSDMLLKASGGVWSPAWEGLRVGLTYDLGLRDSTIDASVGTETYDYVEHRGTVGLKSVFNIDPSAPDVREPAGWVPLDYGVGATGDIGDEERIQDLLRQDEAARRGSSCVE